jgi:hypothetical protein
LQAAADVVEIRWALLIYQLPDFHAQLHGLVGSALCFGAIQRRQGCRIRGDACLRRSLQGYLHGQPACTHLQAGEGLPGIFGIEAVAHVLGQRGQRGALGGRQT